MPPVLPPSDTAPSGDRARRRGALCLLIAVIATPIAAWLFLNLEPLWRHIAPLEGGTLILAATAFGAVLALTPVAAAFGWLLALWFGVESVYSPRQRATPLADRIIVGTGI
ncbi:MAG: hypothetical protein LBR95_06200, partial [Azoarcus sp.]|nr:hypothetical protein [Azoarcus sp.]